VKKKWLANKKIFANRVSEHSKTKFKYPKLLHLYWDGSPFSFLNYLTVLSFNKHNKAWKIVVHTPANKTKLKSWKEDLNKIEYTGKCYFEKLNDISNVVVNKVHFTEIGFDSAASEIIKSDYFRYYILQKHGGMWSDFDIIYTGCVEEKINYGEDIVLFKASLSLNHKKWDCFPVGMFLATPNNDFFKYIMKLALESYDPTKYESIGATLFANEFIVNTKHSIHKHPHYNNTVKVLDKDYYLPISWYELDKLYVDKDIVLPQKNVGVHWFNGANVSKKFVNNLSEVMESEGTLGETAIMKLIREYVPNLF
jgi:hypothetical protein